MDLNSILPTKLLAAGMIYCAGLFSACNDVIEDHILEDDSYSALFSSTYKETVEGRIEFTNQHSGEEFEFRVRNFYNPRWEWMKAGGAGLKAFSARYFDDEQIELFQAHAHGFTPALYFFFVPEETINRGYYVPVFKEEWQVFASKNSLLSNIMVAELEEYVRDEWKHLGCVNADEHEEFEIENDEVEYTNAILNFNRHFPESSLAYVRINGWKDELILNQERLAQHLKEDVPFCEAFEEFGFFGEEGKGDIVYAECLAEPCFDEK